MAGKQAGTGFGFLSPELEKSQESQVQLPHEQEAGQGHTGAPTKPLTAVPREGGKPTQVGVW